MDKLYDVNNSKHSDLLKDLKSLPKITAPENFEFNLMARIQNKNFCVSEGQKPKFNLVKFFAPSAAVIAVIILFFMFFPQNDNLQQQVQSQVTVGDTQAVIAEKEINNIITQKIRKSDRTNTDRLKDNTSSTQNKNKFVVPISPSRSVVVDDYISGAKSNSGHIVGGATVNNGSQPLVDGFFIEKKMDKQTLEKYRDSLKRAQEIADSLKKVNK